MSGSPSKGTRSCSEQATHLASETSEADDQHAVLGHAFHSSPAKNEKLAAVEILVNRHIPGLAFLSHVANRSLMCVSMQKRIPLNAIRGVAGWNTATEWGVRCLLVTLARSRKPHGTQGKLQRRAKTTSFSVMFLHVTDVHTAAPMCTSVRRQGAGSLQ